ncbi:unnamed protein product [Brassica rapa subsp. trilocularis]
MVSENKWLLSLHQIGLDVNRTDRSLSGLCLCLDRPRCRLLSRNE